MNKCLLVCILMALCALAHARDTKVRELVEDNLEEAIKMAEHVASWESGYRFKASPSFLEVFEQSTPVDAPTVVSSSPVPPVSVTPAVPVDATTPAVPVSNATVPAVVAATPVVPVTPPAVATPVATPVAPVVPVTTPVVATPVAPVAPVTTPVVATPAATPVAPVVPVTTPVVATPAATPVAPVTTTPVTTTPVTATPVLTPVANTTVSLATNATTPTLSVNNTPIVLPDACSVVKCLNKGTCENGKCKCTTEWEGIRCQISMQTPANPNTPVPMNPPYDACQCGTAAAVPCAAINNTCADAKVKPIITKMPASINLSGVSVLYPCHNIPCQHAGKCVRGKCNCPEGFLGVLCEVNKCDSIKCQNGGYCKGGKCACSIGFYGDFCEVEQCSKIQCQNGGSCMLGKCACTANFSGEFCQHTSQVGQLSTQVNEQLHEISKKIATLEPGYKKLQNQANFTITSDGLVNATKQVLSENRAFMHEVNDQHSNSYALPRRLLLDRYGKIAYHNLPLPEDIKADIDAVPITNKKLRTDLRSLVYSDEVQKNATTLRKELVDNMAASAAIGLVETEGSVEEQEEQGEEELEQAFEQELQDEDMDL